MKERGAVPFGSRSLSEAPSNFGKLTERRILPEAGSMIAGRARPRPSRRSDFSVRACFPDEAKRANSAAAVRRTTAGVAVPANSTSAEACLAPRQSSTTPRIRPGSRCRPATRLAPSRSSSFNGRPMPACRWPTSCTSPSATSLVTMLVMCFFSKPTSVASSLRANGPRLRSKSNRCARAIECINARLLGCMNTLNSKFTLSQRRSAQYTREMP